MVSGRKLYVKFAALTAETQWTHRINEPEHLNKVGVLNAHLMQQVTRASLQLLNRFSAELLELCRG